MYRYKIKNINRIVDGDTIDIDIDLGFSVTISSRIRLKGINTPETRTKNLEEKRKGILAKEWLEKTLTQEETWIIDTYKDDKYGRMLGIIYKENELTSINEIMIKENLAEVYEL